MSQSSSNSITLSRLRRESVAGLAVLFDSERSQLKDVVKSLLHSRLANRVDASDVVQETFIAANRTLDDYLRQPTVSPRIWLRRLAAQVVERLTRFHAETPKRSVDAEQEARLSALEFDMPSPRTLVDQTEQADKARQLIASMKEIDREVLCLRHFDRLSFRDIAHVLDVDYNTVRKRYMRAVIRLRKVIAESGDSDA